MDSAFLVIIQECQRTGLQPIELLGEFFDHLQAHHQGLALNGYAKSLSNQANVGHEIQGLLQQTGKTELPASLLDTLALVAEHHWRQLDGLLKLPQHGSAPSPETTAQNDRKLKVWESLAKITKARANQADNAGLQNRLIMEEIVRKEVEEEQRKKKPDQEKPR